MRGTGRLRADAKPDLGNDPIQSFFVHFIDVHGEEVGKLGRLGMKACGFDRHFWMRHCRQAFDFLGVIPHQVEITRDLRDEARARAAPMPVLKSPSVSS